MARRFRVGLTGGIGSGKSTVAQWLAELGAGVVDTDAIAKRLTAPGGAALPAIRQAFGEKMLDRDGSLDRTAMRLLAFSDPKAKEKLETILHPLIRAESLRQIEAAQGRYVVVVVPLLAENLDAYRPFLDRIAVVDCEESQQLARTASRPGLDLAQAKAILASQSSRSQRLNIADDVIENRGGLVALRERVGKLHQRYLHLAAGESEKNPNNTLR
jgi:dephospho-CoA kinase